ncbi:MAG: dipeptide ABC transporter ATP-binding protein [Burkholderiales bacterium]|jgi:oligopeptide/dipeptide ABC transporter ATP-binding protein|nr:dipeptide ABC transporter ATP-binding protein [Burkholderiales bacterium]
MSADPATPLLRVENLVKHFPIRTGFFARASGAVRAVDGVSFDVAVGETLALVGESGCGKSTTGRLILRLIEPTSGKVTFGGEELTRLTEGELRRHRRAMQIIFQDPFASLNPRMTVGQTLEEPLALHGLADGNRASRVREILRLVGLAPEHARRYPHEFSGGQRQRIGIARALAVEPRLIVCDEPVSALDVSIQAQVVNLLRDLQARFGLSYVFIAHDLAVVKFIATRIAVMYLGRIVEYAGKHDLFDEPRHPYTQALLSSIPIPRPGIARRRIPLEGDVPTPSNPPSGCRFRTRCPHARPRCAEEAPALEATADGHAVACHYWRELAPREPILPGTAAMPRNPRLEALQAAFRASRPDSGS